MTFLVRYNLFAVTVNIVEFVILVQFIREGAKFIGAQHWKLEILKPVKVSASSLFSPKKVTAP